MIIQNLLDLIRDIILNWVVGIAQLWPSSSVDPIIAGFGVPSAQMGSVLAIFYTATGWGIVVSTLATSIALFVITVPIKAILGRIRT